MPWTDSLLPASWRGIPFGVLSASIRPGRTVAVHSYPYREATTAAPSVWAEDTGSAPHSFEFSGFLVDGDVFALGLPIFLQRDIMVAACQQPGTGLLIHPSLGARTVALIEPPELVERSDMGGAIELRFRFVESAPGPLYPTTAQQTGAQVQQAAATTNSAATSDLSNNLAGATPGSTNLSPDETQLRVDDAYLNADPTTRGTFAQFNAANNPTLNGISTVPFTPNAPSGSYLTGALTGNVTGAPIGGGIGVGSAISALGSGAAAVQQGVTTVAGFALQANTVLQVGTVALGAVRGLPGVSGRYSTGNLTVGQSAGQTIGNALAGVTAARTLVASTGAASQSLAAAL